MPFLTTLAGAAVLAYLETTVFLRWLFRFRSQLKASLRDFRELVLDSEIPADRWRHWDPERFAGFVAQSCIA